MITQTDKSAFKNMPGFSRQNETEGLYPNMCMSLLHYMQKYINWTECLNTLYLWQNRQKYNICFRFWSVNQWILCYPIRHGSRWDYRDRSPSCHSDMTFFLLWNQREDIFLVNIMEVNGNHNCFMFYRTKSFRLGVTKLFIVAKLYLFIVDYHKHLYWLLYIYI